MILSGWFYIILGLAAALTYSGIMIASYVRFKWKKIKNDKFNSILVPILIIIGIIKGIVLL